MAKDNVVKLKKWTSKVSNSVEDDLLEELKNTILANPDWGWEQLSIQDVYAYALNQLPPVYRVEGDEPENKISKSEIQSALNTAMEKVMKNPIHLIYS